MPHDVHVMFRDKRASGESRRSTRVRLKVGIEAQGISEPLACEGETVVVNLHGAMILTGVKLHVGMSIAIHVVLTDKRAFAKVVLSTLDQPRYCGIELAKKGRAHGRDDRCDRLRLIT